MQNRKTAEAGKNALGPLGGEKKRQIRHLEKKKIAGWKNKMLVGKKTWRLKKMSVGLSN